MIKVKIPMKKIALIAALFLFAGVITVLFACTPEAHTNFDADKTFSRLLEEVRYSAELEDASEYSDYILSDLPEGTDVKMYICGGQPCRCSYHVQGWQQLRLARNPLRT